MFQLIEIVLKDNQGNEKELLLRDNEYTLKINPIDEYIQEKIVILVLSTGIDLNDYEIMNFSIIYKFPYKKEG